MALFPCQIRCSVLYYNLHNMRRAILQPRFAQIELTDGRIWGVPSKRPYDPFDLYERGMGPHLAFATAKDPLEWHKSYGPLFGLTTAYSSSVEAFLAAQRRFVAVLNLWQAWRANSKEIRECFRRAVAETGYVALPGHDAVTGLNPEWQAEANGEELSAEQRHFLRREFPTFDEVLEEKSEPRNPEVTIGSKHPYVVVEEFARSASREDLRRAAEELLKLVLAARLGDVQPVFSNDRGFDATWVVRDFLEACYLMLFYDMAGKKITRNCKECGQFFYPTAKRLRFCSSDCARKKRQRRYWKRRGKLARRKRRNRAASEPD